MAIRGSHHYNLGVALLIIGSFILEKGLALELMDKVTSQSSTYFARDLGIYLNASRSVDGDFETISHTECDEANQWWRVDLGAFYCLQRISLFNRKNCCVRRLEGAEIRAGSLADHTLNAMIGSPVTQSQAESGRVIEFIPDPFVTARYVSVVLPTVECLHFAEIMIEEVVDDEQTDPSTPNSVEFTMVAKPALIGQTGDNDAVLEAYKGPSDVAAAVSFGRQLPTAGGNSELPSGSFVVTEPSTGCAATLSYRLPEEGGISRTGAFYAEATKNDMTTRIPTIILAKDESIVHIRPVQRTQTANVGDSVTLRMRNINSPNSDYRWTHNGGDVIVQWNGQLSVAISDVTSSDAGIYSCFASGEEDQQLYGIMRLIVRGCPAGMWGPPSCQNTCRRCYNGGICHDKTGFCSCAPGFSGQSCEQVHGSNIFGKHAVHSCSDGTDPHDDACRGRLFCLPDPYGCSCAASYTELDCMQECEAGMYGADCKQTCHCASGGTCLKDTGECSRDCQSPYFGINCQCSVEHAVLGLKVSSDDAHQLYVTWQPDPCASGYTLEYELTNRGQCEEIRTPQRVPIPDTLSGQTTYHVISGLESRSTYMVYIRPQYDDVPGPQTSASGITLRRDNYTSVAPLELISRDAVSMTLGWQLVFCAEYYDVQYALTYRDSCEFVDPVIPVQHCMCSRTTSTAAVSGLSPNSRYTVEVRARVDGENGPTEAIQVMTSTSEPTAPPTQVTVTSVMQRSLSFSWSEPQCGGRGGIITGYTYVLTETGSEPIQSFTAEASVTISDLIPFKNYTFRTAAHTSAGAGPYSEGLLTRTLEAEPTVPLNVHIQNVDDASITLVWLEPDPPHGIITHYNVQYWVFGRKTATLVGSRVTQMIHRIADLKANVTYVLQVQAETSVGGGPWSEAINATTRIGVPGLVRNLRWILITDTSITLSWNPPLSSKGQIVGYMVGYRAVEKPYQPGFTAEDTYIMKEVDSESFMIVEIDPATKYEFQVSAVNQEFTGDPHILEVYTKPQSEPPAPPQPILYEDEATDTTVTIGIPTAIPGDDYIQSYVVWVKKTSLSMTRREALIPKHYRESADDYIAAELTKQGVPNKFIVGDSNMYGGYWNAPLQTGATYDISIGSVSRGNGTEASVSFSKPLKVGETRASSATGGVVAAVILVAVAVCLVAGIVVYRRRRHSVKQLSDDELSAIPLDRRAPHNFSEKTLDVSSNSGFNVNPPIGRSPVPLPTPGQTKPAPGSEKPGNSMQYSPVRVNELSQYIHMKESAGEAGFKADYKTLPNGQLHPWIVATKPENKAKNRYANIVAYDHSRVVLDLLGGDPHSDYINACYIDGYRTTDKYIASQGPNKASLCDIWRMVWQLEVDKIVMLTNPVEKGKVKCLQYWADNGSTTYSDITVTTVKEDVFLDYTIRVFHINQVGQEDNIRTVKQFHYTSWPDMKPPEYPAPLLNFMCVVNAEHYQGRIVVHCSAGVGRTGTYIALESLLEQLKKEGQVDVLGFIYRMRQKRIKMVQTPEQYKFIFDALLAASLTDDTTYNSSNFRQKLAALKGKENAAKETGIEKQFETMGELSVGHAGKSKKSGELPENFDKNRYPECIPPDRARPFLMTKVHDDDTNYINATFLPGHRTKSMYVGTQMPMPNTVADIWRLVYDHSSTCIVMLNSLDDSDKSMCRYWPKEERAEFGQLVVELLQTKEYRGVTERTFSLRNKKAESEAARTVSHFQYQDWPCHQEVPNSFGGLLTLLDLTQKRCEDKGPIVVHCIDGLGCTAVYCTLMTLLEQFKAEKVVDVFQAAHRLRMVNANMMYSVAHYAMCYDAFHAYLDSSSIYENFTASAENESFP